MWAQTMKVSKWDDSPSWRQKGEGVRQGEKGGGMEPVKDKTSNATQLDHETGRELLNKMKKLAMRERIMQGGGGKLSR